MPPTIPPVGAEHDKAGAGTPASMAGLRTLVVQHKGDSAEAKVLACLLNAMHLGALEADRPATLVMQLGREYLASGERLGRIPGVSVLSTDIGGTLGERHSRWHLLRLLAQWLFVLPRFIARARAFKPDVIYSSQQRWDVRLAIVLAAFTQRPHVIHLHYPPGPWLGKQVVGRLKACAQVICVSEFIRQQALQLGVPADRCNVIRNALPLSAVATVLTREEARAQLYDALGFAKDDVLVGMVARIDPGKGQLELVQAMVPLLTGPDAHCQLILVGTETDPAQGYARTVRQAADRAGVAGRVHWLGRRTDAPDLLRAFDVFAHPSLNEPLGLAVVEALLAGVPCVIWRDGGSAELVRDQQTGLLAETGDVQALSGALAMLCESAALRQRMAAAALADAPRLSDVRGAAQALRTLLCRAASG